MIKKEFVDIVQKRSNGWNKTDCASAVDYVFEALREILLYGDSINIKNFATFETIISDKGDRIGRNPKNPEEIVRIKKRLRPRIVWSKKFKNEFIR